MKGLRIAFVALMGACVLSLPGAQAGGACQVGKHVVFTGTATEGCYTLPAGVSEIQVVAVGAHGQNGGTDGFQPGGPGGSGARVVGRLSYGTLGLASGGSVYAVVDWGGGTGGPKGIMPGYDAQFAASGGGGGGGSDIRTAPCSVTCGDAASVASRKLVAGGGGGGGGNGGTSGASGLGGNGGAAGPAASAGANGPVTGGGAVYPEGGGAGTQGSGGVGGNWHCPPAAGCGTPLPAAGTGAQGPGGSGGPGEGYNDASARAGSGGGGGGGGFWGGGGGAGIDRDYATAGGGGGGGSSLVPSGGTINATGEAPKVIVSYHTGALGDGAGSIAVSVNPSSIPADGTSTTTATVTITDSAGDPVAAEPVTVSSSGSNAISPVVDNGDGTYTATVTAATASGTVQITATDTARWAQPGMQGGLMSNWTILNNQGSTSTSVSSSLNPSHVGDSVTYTATVSPGNFSEPVRFTDNGTTISTCGSVAQNENGIAQCTTTIGTAGDHAIVASNLGNAYFLPSTSPTLTQTVNPAPTTTAVNPSANPTTVASPVTYTATVAPVPDGGTVSFTDGGNAIAGCGAAAVDTSTGKASCTTTPGTAGSHAIVATYSGNSDYVTSTSATHTQTVAKKTTTTGLSSSVNPSTVGQQVTYTATVSATPAGGTVAFTDGGTTIATCGSVTVASGTASCTVTYAHIGSHDIVAAYSGDTNDGTSTSSTLTQAVNASPTTTGLGAAPHPSVVGDQVTYTATLSPTPNGGTIAFTDGGTTIPGCGSVSISSGTAACAVTYASAGTHPVVATYSGNADYQTSVSSAVTQTVNAAPTHISMVASAEPSAVGKKVTFSATVSPTPDGGTVKFTDGGTTISGCGAVAVSAGSAVCDVTYQAAGTRTISSSYTGTANYANSTYGALTHTVNAAPTSTGLSSSAATPAVGDPVTFTASVNPVPDGGTVAFSDDGTTIAACDSAAVDSSTGEATCTTTFATAGSHPIAATYSGNATYQSSPSSTLSQTVSKGASQTALTSSANSVPADQQITLTATVTPAGCIAVGSCGTTTGTVAFKDGVTTIPGCGAAQVDIVTSAATCDTSFASTGDHSIVATYSGDGNYLTSTSSPFTQTASAFTSQTTLASSANPSHASDQVTYTATVTHAPAGGTVAFTDGGTTITGCGAVAVSSGTAGCAVTYGTIGNHSIVGTYSGDSDHQGSTSAALTQAVQSKATTTVLSSSANPSEYGQAVTITATISPVPDGGQVDFTADGSPIWSCSSVAVSATDGTATCQIDSYGVMDHTFGAHFLGTSYFIESTAAPFTQTIGGSATTTTLRSNPSQPEQGYPIALIASVAGAANGGGTVEFTDGGATIPGCDAVTMDVSGSSVTATCHVNVGGLGDHSFVAHYVGDVEHLDSTSAALEQTWTQGHPQVFLTTPGAQYGKPVTYTAAIVPNPGGGTVAFTDGGQAIPGCGAVDVSGSQYAYCQTTSTALGSHTIVAAFSGSADYIAASSAPSTMTTGKASTDTSVAAPPTVVVGSQVTLTASVTPAPDGGTVGFAVDGTTVAGCDAVAVASGTATCSYLPPATGTYSVAATFSGNAHYTGSASEPRTGTVKPPVPATTLSSSADPAAVGQQVTYTALVSPASAGGTYSFRDNGVSIPGCGFVTVGNGAATCSVTYATVGTHAIRASHAASGSSDGSFAILTQVVTQDGLPAATATTLVSSADPSVAGSVVTYTATVTPKTDGGTVAFTDGGAAVAGCGAATIDASAGTATCQVPYDAAGSHELVATYSGTTLFAGSQSPALVQTVTAASSDSPAGTSPPAGTGDTTPPPGTATPPPNVATTPHLQKASLAFGDQRLTLTFPADCVGATSGLRVSLSTTRLKSRKTKLIHYALRTAGFFIDGGLSKKVKGRTVRLPNASAKALAGTITIKLAGLRSGKHTLKLVLTLSEPSVRRGAPSHVVQKALTRTLTVCR